MKAVSTLRKQRSSRRGAVGPFAAVMLAMLLGMTALALDSGYLYNVKSDLQNCADASALAAAITLFDVDGIAPNTAYQSALNLAARNLGVSTGVAAGMMDFDIGHYDDPFDHSEAFVPVVSQESNAVRVVLHRTEARGHAVGLFFARIFGKDTSDVSAMAVAGRAYVDKAPLVPIALRAPGFGPVDPDVEEHNPGKDGPSYPANDESFEIGEKVTVFTFGKGPRPMVHLTLDLPEFNGVNGTNDILAGTYEVIEGRYPEIIIGIGDQYYVENLGTGNQNFGVKLLTRMNDGNESNDTVVIPIVQELPDSRDTKGRLAGKVEIVGLVGVHLYAVEEVTVPNEWTPNNPDDTLTIEILTGHVVPVSTHGSISSQKDGYSNSVFTPILFR